MAIDFVPPAFVEEIGDANFRRFIYRDSIEQFFTGSSWTENLSGAALYHKESDAIAAQMQYSEGQRTYDTYTATIVVTTEKDAWALEDLLNLLKKSARTVMTKQLDENGVMTELIWEDLKKVEPFGEVSDGPV